MLLCLWTVSPEIENHFLEEKRFSNASEFKMNFPTSRPKQPTTPSPTELMFKNRKSMEAETASDLSSLCTVGRWDHRDCCVSADALVSMKYFFYQISCFPNVKSTLDERGLANAFFGVRSTLRFSNEKKVWRKERENYKRKTKHCCRKNMITHK